MEKRRRWGFTEKSQISGYLGRRMHEILVFQVSVLAEPLCAVNEFRLASSHTPPLFQAIR